MRNLLLTFGLFLSLRLIAAQPPLWIAGTNYVALDQNGQTKFWNGIDPSSFAFDEIQCALWVADKTSGKLLKFSSDRSEPLLFGKTDALLSNVDNAHFFSRTADLLEKRSLDGIVSKTFLVPELTAVMEIRATGTQGYACLQKFGKELSLDFVDPEFKVQSHTTVSSNTDLWNVERLLYDPQLNRAWIGYTATTPGHIYSPILKSYSSEGVLKDQQIYSRRGIFWDLCLTKDHSVLFSYDVPSPSGFTLPINSYLDSFTSMGVTPKFYAAETNYFIDALSCAPDAFYMIQRPIFGSEKSRVVSYTARSGEQTLFNLPAAARKIFHCVQ